MPVAITTRWKAALAQQIRRGLRCPGSVTPVSAGSGSEIAEGLVELLLAGNALGVVELAADFAARVQQVTAWTLGQRGGAGSQGPGATTHDGNALVGATGPRFGLVAGALG